LFYFLHSRCTSPANWSTQCWWCHQELLQVVMETTKGRWRQQDPRIRCRETRNWQTLLDHCVF